MRIVCLELGVQGQSDELNLYCVLEIIYWRRVFYDIISVT